MSERLEEIKSRVWKDEATYADGDNKSREGHTYTLSDYDYEWLIKQAELAEQLEEAIDDGAYIPRIASQIIEDLEKKNKRYREAMVSALSEIEYALYSQKPLKVKEHYLKNAKRYINQALREESK